MVIYLGADHRGFNLKEQIKALLQNSGYAVHDMGAEAILENDDYPDYAKSVAERVSMDSKNSRGVLVCASGVGMDIAANKFANVRSVLAMSPDHAMVSRSDDDTNILCLGADFIEANVALKTVSVWMQTPFSEEENHKRRIEQLKALDHTSH
ncbi:MAG: ribose-5-phosphate isomerase [Candidatus Colwellbacteria bacterium CG10_big_fil_rev_8_21_14_0_10_42_22]|uniref:Ribose-5-phosphate isomerase n=1 Tax=Candidatus Colwellbacteria bacterium CG10_big_fil_rev_8_21_14_0_10_42_22 TaxID=1974540 RepID=A0A2H0VGI0_9BACT|nr:MAG: ribose-5-phosphate isomerase [Candidatus Colwellbacteria bacterium CG10_big_fil_rev_8_21_14_0_10_42_22]